MPKTSHPSPDGQPSADPFPALVAHLRAWVAEHADVIDSSTIKVIPPRDVFFTACYCRSCDFEVAILNQERANLKRAILADTAIPRRLNHFITIAGPGYRHDPDAIPLDDPSAPAIIADRIRSADDLRAELARVTGERDALVSAMTEPAVEQVWKGKALGLEEVATGRWFSVDIHDRTTWQCVFDTQVEAEADVLNQIRKTLETSR